MECLLESSHSQIKLGLARYKLKIFYLSGYAMLAYGLLITLTLFGIIWVIFQVNKEGEFIYFFEICLSVLALIDLALKIYLLGFCIFIRNLFNIIDTLICFCTLTYTICVLFKIYIENYVTLASLLLLGFRNCFNLARLVILLKKLNGRRVSVYSGKSLSTTKSLEHILEDNRKVLKQAHRPRLYTLSEEEEIFEDSSTQKHSVWKGRVKDEGDIFDTDINDI